MKEREVGGRKKWKVVGIDTVLSFAITAFFHIVLFQEGHKLDKVSYVILIIKFMSLDDRSGNVTIVMVMMM